MAGIPLLVDPSLDARTLQIQPMNGPAFNAVATAGGGGSCGALTRYFYVSPSAVGGNGSPCSPYSLAAAIAAAPSLPFATTLILTPGDYEPEGPIAYTDKRISVRGSQLFNQSSTTTPTHGVFLRPSSTGGVNMVLELSNTNCNISAQTAGLQVVTENCYVEAVSTVAADWHMSGTSTLLARGGTQGTTAGSIIGTNMGLADSVAFNGFNLRGCDVNGPLSQGNGTSSLRDTFIQFSLSGGRWQLWNCTFSTAVVLGDGVDTDLATYERGLRAGVTFPLDTDIFDL